ncbi:MAG: LysE family translocator [Halochromatium sp.]|uniref:LysE family translocator n=1 Tax=Halochromatium sp. TaxID=2049430 RepID=UPI00397D8E8F
MAASSQPSTQYRMGHPERVRWYEPACMHLGEALILFVTMMALAALPSASVVLVVARSATVGLRHGLAVAFGIVLGDLIYVATAVFGLAALADALGGLFLLVKLLGALYLIWLGSRMLFSRAWPSAVSATPVTPSGLLGSVVAGLLLTLGDLKAILFYASLFPLFVDLDQLRIVDVLLIIVITTLSVGGVKLLYALAARKLAARARSARMGRVGQRGAGALLLGAGGYLIATAPR